MAVNRLVITTCLCIGLSASTLTATVFAQTQTAPTTVADPEAAPDQDLRDEARAYMASQDYDKAIACLKALLADNPADALALKIDLALCYKGKKNYTSAMATCSEIIASEDRALAARAFYITTDCFFEQGKKTDGIATLTRAYIECPDARPEILLRRASRYADAMMNPEYLADVLEVQSSFPERFAEAKLLEGLARMALGKSTLDSTELAKGIKILKDYPAAFLNEQVFAAGSQFFLGKYYVESGHTETDAELKHDMEKGRAILSKAVLDYPSSKYTWKTRSAILVSYMQAGCWSQCNSEIDLYLKLNPPAEWDEHMLNTKWRCLIELKRIDEAEQMCQTLLQKYPNGQGTKMTQAAMAKYLEREAAKSK